MRTSFAPEEVDKIENSAYDLGMSIGAHQERERILLLLKSFADKKVSSDILEAIDMIKEVK